MFSQIIILSLICVNPISLHREEDIDLHPDLKVRHRRQESPETTTTDPELNQDVICKGEHTHFKVTAGFKLDDFIGLVGKLWKEPDSEDKAIDVAIRVTVWQQPDPSQQTSYDYFDATVWPDIYQMNKEKRIKYAFSADFITDLFGDYEGVTFSARREKVFIVQDTNTTTAINFAKEQKQGPNDLPVLNILEKKVVYNSSVDFDLSAYLSIKLLYLHFPQELRIIGIVLYHRFQPPHHEATHYAIVYTEEVFEGKSYFFRHYMKAERNVFTDYREGGSSVTRLDWFIDERIDFCDQMEKGPDGVVLMSLQHRQHSDTREDLIRWMEVYGTKHTVMQMSFQIFGNDYTIHSITEYKKDIDNAKSLLHCEPHPAAVEKTPIPCDDYIVRDIDRDEWIKKSESEKSWKTFYIIAIILSIIGIIVLLVIGGLLLSSRNK